MPILVGTEHRCMSDRAEKKVWQHHRDTSRRLHWLPGPQRINYKLFTHVQVLAPHGAIISLCDVCPSVDWSCSLVILISCQQRSTDTVQQNYRLLSSPCSFAVSGLRCWNHRHCQHDSSAAAKASAVLLWLCVRATVVNFLQDYTDINAVYELTNPQPDPTQTDFTDYLTVHRLSLVNGFTFVSVFPFSVF